MKKVSWFAIIFSVIWYACFFYSVYIIKDVVLEIYTGVHCLAIFIYIENRIEK